MKKTLLSFVVLLVCISAFADSVCLYRYYNHDSAIYEDEYVKVAFWRNELAIINKTNEILYLDKANSFVYINRVPQSLFSNSVQTTSNTSTGGASVNLGSVAGALGIGGSIGTLLGGVNVGGSRGTGTSTSVYEQRILSLAPGAIYTLYKGDVIKDMNPNILKVYDYDNKRPRFIENGTKIKAQKGMTKEYSVVNSPLVYRGVLTYSTTENFQTKFQAEVSNYIYAVVCDSSKGVRNGQINYSKAKYCLPYKDKENECDFAIIYYGSILNL